MIFTGKECFCITVNLPHKDATFIRPAIQNKNVHNLQNGPKLDGTWVLWVNMAQRNPICSLHRSPSPLALQSKPPVSRLEFGSLKALC